MKIRAIINLGAVAIAATADPAMAAEPTATVMWSWENTRTQDQTPLHPGDGARVWVDVGFTPDIGTELQFSRGLGVLVGLQAINTRLDGSGGTDGRWGDVARTAPWALGDFTSLPDGTVDRWEAGAFLFIHHFPRVNPARDITWATWIPDDYSPRTIEFRSSGVGTGISLRGELPNNVVDWRTVDPANIDWGSFQIPIIPGPGAAALLALAAIAAARRRRLR